MELIQAASFPNVSAEGDVGGIRFALPALGSVSLSGASFQVVCEEYRSRVEAAVLY
jgi:hypothetical protein